MTLQDLIAEFRDRTRDLKAPYLWSDAEVTRFYNEAQEEACRRARLIVDSVNSLARLTMVAGRDVYPLDTKVLFVRRARLVGRSPLLRRVSYKELDCQGADWETETGEPRAYVPDMNTGFFRPYPIPTAAGQVNLTVVRLPLDCMEANTDEPEIAAHYHHSLTEWALFRAYSKRDAETFDPARAGDHLNIFEGEFGKKSSAIDEAWIQMENGYIDDDGVF